MPIGIVGLTSWLVWLTRRSLSHRYRPTVNDHRETVSVVVPVYREDPDVLERCLRTWVSQQPFEVILVVDDRDDQVLERLRALDLAGVCVLPWRHTGKRGALGAGIRAARGDIVVLADSDTSWRPGLLNAVQMPFSDPRVGGVGTRQYVYARESNLVRRIAHWLLNTRYLDYVPALSRTGSVPCLSGRTAAYRRDIIRPRLAWLEREVFLGRECVSGDDGRLTWLVLAAGYRAVHQDSARADSMFPDSVRAFVRQRVRWSRNSYRCYLTAIGHGWLWRQPLLTQVTVLQILLTPFTMASAVWYGAQWMRRGGAVGIALVLAWACLARAVRGLSHLREHPADLWIAPVMVAVVLFIALPVKTWAFLSMNRQGWLTRTDARRVQGQAEIVGRGQVDAPFRPPALAEGRHGDD
ncbi:glycosyltransferase [Nocardioides panacis]|uniref:Glycosyltransferase n=1 Tax=Nocardioides panacis TaxID=2849501 RepID=A0A975T318_9ACTN|nr:glycosyltransferase [Nocardioides panacis]QWZ09969.1 glycosyltransferase [Nocardioides panacis]